MQPEETPNTRELISRAGKIFLGGLGEPVASGDGRAVQETTNSLLIDVVDAMRELFTTSKKEIAASCRRRSMVDHRGERASSAAGSSRKPTNDTGARRNASCSKVRAAGWHQAATQGKAGGCGNVSSTLETDSQPLG